MDRWCNKVAVVTGASTGIGAATALELVKQGMIVVGMARSTEKVNGLKTELPENLKPKLYSRFCDVSNENSIIEAFDWVEKELGGADVLVNNAGIIIPGLLSAANNSEAVRTTIDTNFTGVVFCTRQVLLSLAKRNMDGHIININSIWGHIVPKPSEIVPNHNVYHATKFAVTGLTDTLRQELNYLKKRTKVTSISPGATATDRLTNHMENMLDHAVRPIDIAHAIIYALSTPENVQVSELTVGPVNEKI